MPASQTIRVRMEGFMTTITLERPDVRNAMNIEMIRELISAFRESGGHDSIRIVVLRAEGPHFSAGADLKWMKEGQEHSRKQLMEESRELALLFRTIHRSRQVVISAVQGMVMGGANGLVAASDIVLAEASAQFAFSEVKLGLIPATIAPYILRKTGYSRTAELMLTGRRFNAGEAAEMGLVHLICQDGTLEKAVKKLTGELLTSGPEAMKGIKELLRRLQEGVPEEELIEYTSGLIATYRISEEGQEGINAFFEKRKPAWYEPA